MHVLIWYEAREEAKQAGAAVLPSPLSETIAAPVEPASAIHLSGWEFAFSSAITHRTTSKGGTTVLDLADGAHALISEAGDPPFTKAWREVPAMQRIFTTQELSSDLGLARAAANALPTDVSLWRSNTKTQLLLMMKKVDFHEADAIHPVSNPYLQGFQSDLGRKKAINLDLYDKQGRHAWILYTLGPTTTQRDINTLIASIEPPH